jgi:hypothetical protein
MKQKFILSFPRSGNHLLRFMVEFLTGCKTQGCLDNAHDKPIATNTFPLREDVLSHVGDCFVAIKAHSTQELFHPENLHTIGSGGIILIRSPRNCIRSHILKRDPQLASLGQVQLGPVLQQWAQIVTFALRTDHHHTAIIKYEDLLTRSTFASRALPRIAKVFSESFQPARAELLIDDFEEMLKISATGEGRAWGGISKPENLVLADPQAFQDAVSGVLNQLLELCRNAGEKYSHDRAAEIRNTITAYQRENY